MNLNPRRGKYTIVPYQSTHDTGGTVMGADPNTSVVNKYLQSWDVHNLFVIGAGNFPQNGGYNPTGIKTKYLKTPGALAQHPKLVLPRTVCSAPNGARRKSSRAETSG